jgi:hypothetical protein
MKTKRTLPWILAGALLLEGAASARAKELSDIVTIDKRRAIVEEAIVLAKPPTIATIPATIPNPFAPLGFDQAEGGERTASGPARVDAPPTDRELLKSIASQIRPSGTIMVGSTPMLMFGKRFVKVGSHFTVTYKGTDYDLELTAVEGTNFTLSLNREQITRPIQTGKTP